MLPPVRTKLSSYADYQTQPQLPLPRQRSDVGINLANAGPATSNPLAGARLDVLPLSAQLQLAQGISIFAETIGKLIKVARREGEALLDYTKRLFEAVKALGPAERANLERTLNQLVKGITLQLLNEILTDPKGSNAARLATGFETPQVFDRDLAAKTVVSSYRQNAGAEQQAGHSLPHPANVAAVPPAAARPASEVEAFQPDAEPATSEADPTRPAATTTESDAEAVAIEAFDGSSDAAVAATVIPAEPAMDDAPAQSLMVQPETEEATPHLSTDNHADIEISAGSESLAGEAQAEIFDQAVEQPRQSHPARQADPDPSEQIRSERRSLTPVLYDGPTLIRFSQKPLNEARSSLAEKAMIPAISEWLAETVSGSISDALQAPPAGAETLPERQALRQLLNTEASARPPVQPNLASAENALEQDAGSASDPDKATPSARPANGPAGPAEQAADSKELAEKLVLPMPLPLLTLREGVPLPYVAYPQEGRHQDPEERGAQSVSATDEDGEDQHSAGGQAFRDGANDDSPKDESEETGSAIDDDETAPSSPANDLYWRMAGWA